MNKMLMSIFILLHYRKNNKYLNLKIQTSDFSSRPVDFSVTSPDEPVATNSSQIYCYPREMDKRSSDFGFEGTPPPGNAKVNFGFSLYEHYAVYRKVTV